MSDEIENTQALTVYEDPDPITTVDRIPVVLEGQSVFKMPVVLLDKPLDPAEEQRLIELLARADADPAAMKIYDHKIEWVDANGFPVAQPEGGP